MAIAYSYPQEAQLSGTDMLIGTAINEVDGRKKLITKNFTLQTLGQFIITNYLPESFPSLQEVTDIGNITTTTVILDGGATSNSINEIATFQPGSISTVNTNTGSGVEIASLGYIGISNDGVGWGYIGAEYVTEEVLLQIPNKTTGTYTIATTEDINTQGLPPGGTAGQILTKVDSTDYNAAWQENYADWTSHVKHLVKNNGLSGTITKGTAVYVTGSNGTNMLVGRASNASEATSSKTMGLMQSDITTTGANQTGFVITEGLLEGLDTSGHIAGEPVWLGVNGALIYGLANKPYAPAHLVFIGIVTKISAGNGEIFVKVQNGFELKEIHDVDIVTNVPINGDVLGYNGTLWVNKTVAGWLGFTPANKAGDTFTGNIDAPSMSIDGTDLESLMIAYAVALG